MAEAVTLEAVMAWFREYQKNCIIKDGVVPEWFHGIISRKQSEEMLMTKPPGCFLICVSESRIGYTLSYRANDCCRHFMIDMLPDNQYVIVGEKTRHRSLDDLVLFYSQTSIAPFTELLTVACDPVSKDQVECAELLFSKNNACHPGSDIWPNMSQPNARYEVSHLSVLPQNLDLNMSITTDTTPSSPRLYPSLEEELGILNLHNTETLLPLPRARSKSMDTSPQTPSRHNKPTTGKEKRLPKQSSEQKSPTELKAPLLSLAQCKKIFQKKKNHSEEQTFRTNDEATNKNISEAMVKRDGLLNNWKAGLSKSTANVLPTEYLNPPPFAPGY
ncbi:hematopoietic SH2 domain-containing protein homolog [Trichomycterus rosablanca]|uniref:hematopoietic SH2 domain-containing protein homolog n=1 Tax=Trichomycterus rosablanca TaxID=2290929 RepID=UPI002F35CB76